MKISALYARVSTTGQEKEQTINSQIAEIELRVKEDGNKIEEKFIFIDDGWTSELLARPALDSLRDAIKNKSFEVLYVYDLGRLSRNFLNQLILKKEITDAGINIISLHDINGESQESRLAQNVMGLFHDYERIKIAERFRRGKLYKAKNGTLFGWQAPYGYKYIKSNEKDKGYFEINEEEAKVVRLIFNLLVFEHLSLRKIVKKLYELKIKSPEGKEIWAMSNLSRLVKREDYTGTAHYNKSLAVYPIKSNSKIYRRIKNSSRQYKPKTEWIPISVPLILDKNTFLLAQEQVKKNQSLSPRNVKRSYLLRGLLFCNKCKSRYTGETTRTYKHYRSSLRIKMYPHKPECTCRSIHGEMIENLVWSEISNLLSNPKLIKEQYNKWLLLKQKRSNAYSLKLPDIEEKLNTLNKTEKRLIDGYAEGVIALDYLKSKLSDIKLDKSKLEQDKDHFSNEYDLKSMSKINPKNICKEFKLAIENMTFDKKEIILHTVLKEILIEQDKAIIRGCIPLHIQSKDDLRSNADKGRNTILPLIEFKIVKQIPRRIKQYKQIFL